MEIYFEEIAKFHFAGCERDFGVYTSEKSFASMRMLPVETRQIQWPEEIVFGLHAGSQSTAGYTIAVSRVEANPPGLKIFFEEKHPRPGNIVAQVVTSPGVLIAIQRAALPPGIQTVQFITEDRVVKALSIQA